MRDWSLAAIAYLKELWHKCNVDRVPLAAAAVAFFMLLSLVPLLLLIAGMLSYVIKPEQLENWFTYVTSIFGPGLAQGLRNEVLDLVRSRSILTSVSSLVLLWAGSQIFVTIESALNQIWGVQERRPFWKTRGLALMMMIVAGAMSGVTLMLVYLLQWLGRAEIAGHHAPHLPLVGTLIISYLVPILLVSSMFMLIYWVLPNSRVNWQATMPGAIVAGVIWVIGLHLFSWYTVTIANLSIYGSLASIIVLMLWFNYGAQIMLLGAEITSVNQRQRETAAHDVSAI